MTYVISNRVKIMKITLSLIPGIVLTQSEYYYNHWCQAYGWGIQNLPRLLTLGYEPDWHFLLVKFLDYPDDRSESLPYLDDAYCRKVFPLLERNASPRDIPTCPIQILENIPAGYWPDQSIKNVEKSPISFNYTKYS